MIAAERVGSRTLGPSLLPLRQRRVVVVAAFSCELVEPGGGGDVFASVGAVVDVGFVGQDSGRDERADIQADAVVQVWVPAERLGAQGFPADEDVVGGLPLQDLGEFGLQDSGGLGPGVLAEATPVGRRRSGHNP